jgi:hypothetical protein
MERWQYLIERYSGIDSPDELVGVCNRAGDDGWELVTVDHGARIMWFKQPAAEKEAPTVVTAPHATAPTPNVGQTATCTKGNWTGDPVGYSYLWMRDNVAIETATAATYTLQAADIEAIISCQVTATNEVGEGASTSNAIGPVS